MAENSCYRTSLRWDDTMTRPVLSNQAMTGVAVSAPFLDFFLAFAYMFAHPFRSSLGYESVATGVIIAGFVCAIATASALVFGLGQDAGKKVWGGVACAVMLLLFVLQVLWFTVVLRATG